MAANLVALFQGTTPIVVPEYARATGNDAMAAGLSGGRNRIGLKGARFRLVVAGQEVAVKSENELDVIVVAAAPAISRTFYIDKYDPDTKIAPTCFSADGVVPHESVENKQSTTCASCKQNVKGSATTDNNKKSRACSFTKRLVVMLPGDEKPNTLYQLDCKALSIFGDGKPSQGLYTLSEYGKLLALKGYHSGAVVTRLSFDTDVSVPKLFFTPAALLTEEQAATVKLLASSEEAKMLATVDAVTVNLSDETDLDDGITFDQKPAATAPATPAKPPAKPATKPKELVKAMTEKAGEFTLESFLAEGWSEEDLIAEGYMVVTEVTSAAAPAPAPATPPKPSVPKKPKAAKPEPVAVAPVVQPTVVEADTDGVPESDDELARILANL